MLIRTFIAAVLSAFAFAAAAAVDANSASRADLETVKGIGPGLSAKIVDARKAAPFKDWNDLVDRVGGMGRGNAARLSQGGLTVGGAGFDAGAATPASEPRAKAAAQGNARPAKDKKGGA